jgi:hypothetical protein
MYTIQLDFTPRDEPKTRLEAFLRKAQDLIETFNNYPLYRRHLKFAHIVTKLADEASAWKLKLPADGRSVKESSNLVLDQDESTTVTELTEKLNSISIDNLAPGSPKIQTNSTTPSGHDELELFARKMEYLKKVNCGLRHYILTSIFRILSFLSTRLGLRIMELHNEMEDLQETIFDTIEAWRSECIANEGVLPIFTSEEAKRSLKDQPHTLISAITELSIEVKRDDILSPAKQLQKLSKFRQLQMVEREIAQGIWQTQRDELLERIVERQILLREMDEKSDPIALPILFKIEQEIRSLKKSNVKLRRRLQIDDTEARLKVDVSQQRLEAQEVDEERRIISSKG